MNKLGLGAPAVMLKGGQYASYPFLTLTEAKRKLQVEFETQDNAQFIFTIGTRSRRKFITSFFYFFDKYNLVPARSRFEYNLILCSSYAENH